MVVVRVGCVRGVCEKRGTALGQGGVEKKGTGRGEGRVRNELGLIGNNGGNRRKMRSREEGIISSNKRLEGTFLIRNGYL